MLPYEYHTTLGKSYLKSGATVGKHFPIDGIHPHKALGSVMTGRQQSNDRECMSESLTGTLFPEDLYSATEV